MSLILNPKVLTSNLIKNSTQTLKNKWVKMLVASAIYLLPFVLLFLPYYIGVVLFVLLYGHFTVGFINYTRQLINNQNPSLQTIFMQRTKMWLSVLLGAVFAVGVGFGTVLAVVPAVVFLAFFGLVLYVHQEDEKLSFLGAFKQSVAKTQGYKAEMFSYKIVYYVAYLCVALLSAILMVAVNNVTANTAIVGILLTILLTIVVFIVLVFITAHYQVSNVLFYDSLGNASENKKQDQHESKASKDKLQKDDDTSLIPGSDGSFDVMAEEDEVAIKGEEVSVSQEATIVVSDDGGDVVQDIVLETVHLAETDKASSKKKTGKKGEK